MSSNASPRAPPALSAALVTPPAVVAADAFAAVAAALDIVPARTAAAVRAALATWASLAAPMVGIMLGRFVITNRAASPGSSLYCDAASITWAITPSSPARSITELARSARSCSGCDCCRRHVSALSRKKPATPPSGDTRDGTAPRIVLTPSASCTAVSPAACVQERSSSSGKTKRPRGGVGCACRAGGITPCAAWAAPESGRSAASAAAWSG